MRKRYVNTPYYPKEYQQSAQKTSDLNKGVKIAMIVAVAAIFATAITFLLIFT